MALLCATLLGPAWAGSGSGTKPAAAGAKAAPASKSGAVALKPSAYQARRDARRAVAPASKRKAARRAARPSIGHLSGLHRTDDELDLRSSVALVVDQTNDEVLYSKNAGAVLPIASITKLMTALVVVEAGLSMDEKVAITREDLIGTYGSRARQRLNQGVELNRGEMLRLALMASENRAAHALGRTYPGGVPAFVKAMNAKARALGMEDTRYVEPTGLSSDNRSSAQDLARLVRAASEQPLIREFSTSLDAEIQNGKRAQAFRNTNGLVRSPEWDIEVQKTGFISAAGRCVVMQAQLAGRHLIMVLLDSAGRHSRIGDAERLRRWLLDRAGSVRSKDGALPAAPAVDDGLRASLSLPAPALAATGAGLTAAAPIEEPTAQAR